MPFTLSNRLGLSPSPITDLWHTTPKEVAARQSYKPSLRTFEEEVLATWWTEPHYLQPYSRELLKAGEAAGLDMDARNKADEERRQATLKQASGDVYPHMYAKKPAKRSGR